VEPPRVIAQKKSPSPGRAAEDQPQNPRSLRANRLIHSGFAPAERKTAVAIPARRFGYDSSAPNRIIGIGYAISQKVYVSLRI
jgi:hypothetical protein